MDDKRLDALFRTGLESDKHYDRAESQWAIVSNRLQANKKRRGFWLPLFCGLTVLAIAFFALNSVFFHKQEQESSLIILPDNPVQSSSSTSQTNNITQILKSSEKNKSESTLPESSGEKAQISSTDPIANAGANTQFKKPLQNNMTLSSIEEKKKKEKCNCPDDYKYNNGQASSASTDPSFQKFIYQKVELKGKLIPISVLDPKNKIRLDHFPLLPLIATTKLRRERSLPRTKFATAKILPSKREKRQRMLLSSGLIKDIIARNLIDSTAVTPYFSIGYRFSNRLTARVSYNQQGVNRIFLQGFDGYKINTTYMTTEGAKIIRGAVDYKVQTLDCGIGYELFQSKYFRLEGIAGLQALRKEVGRLSLSVENIYSPEPLEFTTLDEAFNINKSYAGFQLDLPILLGLNLELQYKRIFSLKDPLINWGPQNRIALGLTYQLKL